MAISNKMREMAILKIAIKKHYLKDLGCRFDILKPENFQTIVSATRIIGGYDMVTKRFKAPSLANHMATNLSLMCDLALKLVVERRDIPLIRITNCNEMRTDIKDLKKLIKAHWNSEISSLASKNLRENRWEKPQVVPLTSDIQLLQKHLKEESESAYQSLLNNKDNPKVIDVYVDAP